MIVPTLRELAVKNGTMAALCKDKVSFGIEKAMLNVGAVAVLDKAGLIQTLHSTIVEAVKGQNIRLC